MSTSKLIERAAQSLRDDESNASAIAPVRALFEGDACNDFGRQIKQYNHRYWQKSRQRTGVKTAMTSKAIQEFFALDKSDYGYLYKDRQMESGSNLSLEQMIAPKLEVEFALQLDKDWSSEKSSLDAFTENIQRIMLAFEVVDSRIKDWNIQGLDAIADNAASGRYLLAAETLSLETIPITPAQLLELPVVLEHNGETLHQGCAKDQLGNPIEHAHELANRCCHHEQPLRAGEIILCGAILPLTDNKTLLKNTVDSYNA